MNVVWGDFDEWIYVHFLLVLSVELLGNTYFRKGNKWYMTISSICGVEIFCIISLEKVTELENIVHLSFKPSNSK